MAGMVRGSTATAIGAGDGAAAAGMVRGSTATPIAARGAIGAGDTAAVVGGKTLSQFEGAGRNSGTRFILSFTEFAPCIRQGD